MRKRKLALALASLLMVPSATTYALGLGEIETRSGLNQPLNAEIKLLSVSKSELPDVSVKFADSAAYVTAGIDKSPLLIDIQFVVTQKADGSSVIQLKSSQPIREPFLDFIIEVNWPTGRLLREYTMLLDPPVFASDTSAANVKAPATQDRESPISSAPASSASAGTSSSSAQPSASSEAPKNRSSSKQAVTAGPGDGGATHESTGKNDTLWEIAKRLRPDESVSVEQMMMALFRANPDAFFGNNVNNLKSGFVLRVPDQTELNAINHSTAVREARRQYQRWLEKKPPSLEGDPQQQGLAVRTDSVQEETGKSADAKGQLKLMAPESEGAVRGGNGKGSSNKDAQSLSKELQLAIETGDATRQENDELKARVAALEEQLNTMQRLITLKDDALVDMQSKSGSPSPVDPAPLADVVVDSPVDSSNPAANKDQATAQPEAVPVTPTGESIWSMLASPLVLGILIVVGLLVGALGWIFARRRKQQQADYAEEETFAPLKRNFAFSENPAMTMPIVEQTFSESMDTDEVLHTTSSMEDVPAEDSEIDPLAEADVYLAYRRYQQAEDLIKDALQQEPERQDLQTKLLEVYYAMGNKEAFETQAESFYTTLTSDDREVWEKIVDMGSELSPGHPLFNGEQTPLHAAEQNDFNRKDVVEEVHFDTFPVDDSANVIEFESGFTPRPGDEDRPVFSQFTDAKPVQHSDGNLLEFSLDDDTIKQIRAAADARKGPQGLSDELEGLVVDKLFEDENTPGEVAIEQQSIRQVTEDADLEAMLAQVDDVGFEKVFGFDDTHFGGSDEDLFASNDMVGTKLDLARAYIDMDDGDGARSILGEVLQEGSETQKEEARELMRRMS